MGKRRGGRPKNFTRQLSQERGHVVESCSGNRVMKLATGVTCCVPTQYLNGGREGLLQL